MQPKVGNWMRDFWLEWKRIYFHPSCLWKMKRISTKKGGCFMWQSPAPESILRCPLPVQDIDMGKWSITVQADFWKISRKKIMKTRVLYMANQGHSRRC